MKINWQQVSLFALYGLSVAAKVAPQLGTEPHLQAASDALTTATGVAQQMLTDPKQQEEASASAQAAQDIINLIHAFAKTSPAPAGAAA